jgi:hypothetical protein
MLARCLTKIVKTNTTIGQLTVACLSGFLTETRRVIEEINLQKIIIVEEMEKLILILKMVGIPPLG